MTRVVRALRDAQWLGAERARAYGWILVILMWGALTYDFVSTVLGHHPWRTVQGPSGKPAATDFLAFWSAGHAVLAGRTADAYNLDALSAIEHARAIMPHDVLLAFFYPPTFLLFCLPFALLPYIAGLVAFVGTSLGLMAAGLRRILGPGWPPPAYLPIAAFPGLLMNAATGQTGFWSAACFAWALCWLEARPGLAGAALGMLVIKPHLAMVVPVGLLASRRWRALTACGAVAATWLLLSWSILGLPAWHGFMAGAPAIRQALEHHPEDWSKLQSLFTVVRLAGGGLGTAYAAQFVLALGVVSVLAWVAWQRPGGGPEVAVMVGAAMLCTPHILDYDLAASGVALAWIASQAIQGGWLPWEKLLAGVAFLWPLVARALTQSGTAPLAPLILLGLFGLAVRRALSMRSQLGPLPLLEPVHGTLSC
jgi:hypothetical protein